MIPLLLIIGYLMYLKFIKKEKIENIIIKQKLINYKKEAKNILEKAKKLFNDGREKEAYGKAGEAIRFYFSHKLGLQKELTNYELIKKLKKDNMEFKDVQTGINLSSLVEFAKYETNKKDFNEVIDTAEKIIK